LSEKEEKVEAYTYALSYSRGKKEKRMDLLPCRRKGFTPKEVLHVLPRHKKKGTGGGTGGGAGVRYWGS